MFQIIENSLAITENSWLRPNTDINEYLLNYQNYQKNFVYNNKGSFPKKKLLTWSEGSNK